MSKNYTVEIGEGPFATTISGLTKREAIAEARKACNQTKEPVFVSVFYASEGQTAYLNADGNYNITGHRWN